MNWLKNRTALRLFDMIAWSKGYRFAQVKTAIEERDIELMYSQEGFTFPGELQEQVNNYKKGTVSFVAYYHNAAVGMVRLANPHIINRVYELYGVDPNGNHPEIQGLLVSKDHRDGSQFVMLGLFKAMYMYSRSHRIHSWSSCGTRSVYLTMRRLCKDIHVEHIDFASSNHPLTQYLYNNNIIETYFTMNVNAFHPWSILRRMVRQIIKNRLTVLRITKSKVVCAS